VPTLDADLIAALRADLSVADFTVDTVRGLWSEAAGGALTRSHRVAAQRELAAQRETGELTPAGTLAWLFVLGLPVGGTELDGALPELAADGAAALGLVELDESDPASDRLVPLVDLRPYAFTDARGGAEWWIASDLGELALGHALGPDHVLGVGGASTTLSGLIVSSCEVGLALDLGTGCGIQAMHVARHARRVIATDISARALEYADFNARLNGIANIEFRAGSLFEPVAGERFEQIVSNPPFVITPRVEGVPEYEYRDGGFTGDELVQRVIAGIRDHLAPGGLAQLLGNWEYPQGADGLDRVRAWTAGLDAWVVERELQDAPRYAETWIRDGGTRTGDPEYDRWYAAWLEDFAVRGVEYVGFGYLALRAPERGEPSLARFEQVETSGTNPAGIGEHVARALAAHDELRGLTDAALAELRLRVARDVTEERHSWPGDEAPIVITLHQGAGFGRALQVDPALSGLVGACDGELTVGQIADAIAALFEVDAGELRADLFPRVRELVFTGFLELG
jgi:methylase of polypeptide subunit release factors